MFSNNQNEKWPADRWRVEISAAQRIYWSLHRRFYWNFDCFSCLLNRNLRHKAKLLQLETRVMFLLFNWLNNSEIYRRFIANNLRRFIIKNGLDLPIRKLLYNDFKKSISIFFQHVSFLDFTAIILVRFTRTISKCHQPQNLHKLTVLLIGKYTHKNQSNF